MRMPACNSNIACKRSTLHHNSSRRINLFKYRKHLLKPKMIAILALLLCWNLRNSLAVAVFQPSRDASTNINGISYYNRHQQHSHQNPNSPHHQAERFKKPPLYNPLTQLPSADFTSSRIPFREGMAAYSEERAIGGRSLRIQPQPLPSSISFDYTTSLGKPTELEMSEPKAKKTCGEPSRATRGLLGPTLKRSYFAFTQDEVDEKTKNDEYRQMSERKKRDIQYQQLSKRTGSSTSGSGTPGAAEVQDSPLPWTCETKYEWQDMGSDHYPRFVRTAECKNRSCFNGFFRCRARRYKTKILKRVNSSENTSCEDDDVSLPETLRTNWKFITVTINLCCDCTGRLPGNTDV